MSDMDEDDYGLTYSDDDDDDDQDIDIENQVCSLFMTAS